MPKARLCQHCSARYDGILMFAAPLRVRNPNGRENGRVAQYVRWACPRCGRSEIAEVARAGAA